MRAQLWHPLVETNWQLSLPTVKVQSLFSLFTGPSAHFSASPLTISCLTSCAAAIIKDFISSLRAALLSPPGLLGGPGTLFLLLCAGSLSSSPEKQFKCCLFQEHLPWPTHSEPQLAVLREQQISLSHSTVSCFAVIVHLKLPWSYEDREYDSPLYC